MKKKKRIIVIIVLFLMVSILVSLNKGKPETNARIVSESTSIEARENSAECVSKPPKKISYKVKEEYNNKLLSVTMTDAGIADKSQRSEYVKIPDGTEVIYAKFSVKNVGKGENTIMYTDFSGYADNDACDQYYTLNNMGKTGMDFSERLSTGRKISGTVAFIVPKGTKKFEIEYSPNILFSDNVIFEVDVK